MSNIEYKGDMLSDALAAIESCPKRLSVAAVCMSEVIAPAQA